MATVTEMLFISYVGFKSSRHDPPPPTHTFFFLFSSFFPFFFHAAAQESAVTKESHPNRGFQVAQPQSSFSQSQRIFCRKPQRVAAMFNLRVKAQQQSKRWVEWKQNLQHFQNTVAQIHIKWEIQVAIQWSKLHSSECRNQTQTIGHSNHKSTQRHMLVTSTVRFKACGNAAMGGGFRHHPAWNSPWRI